MGRIIKDITGQRFGKLVAIECVGTNTDHKAIWKCKCDCGNTVNVIGRHLRIGATTSCGCVRKNEFNNYYIMKELNITQTAYQHIKSKLGYRGRNNQEVFNKIKEVVDEIKKHCDHLTVATIDKYWGDEMGKIKDHKGQRFGKLVVREYEGKDFNNRALWKCDCDCGNTIITISSCLTSGNTKSCGCSRKHDGLYARECWGKLGVSSTSFQEIRYRLGYKGIVSQEEFNEIEKIVEDIKKRCDKVSLSNINLYWNYVREEK